MTINRHIAFAIFGSTQRCGTTLLQRIAGIKPSSFCWGENGRVLDKFMEIKLSLNHYGNFELKNTVRYLQEKDPEIWIANMSPFDLSTINSTILESGRVFFENLYFQSTPELYYKIGVKEVENSIEGIEFFKDMFPLSKVVLVARNPVDVWCSLHHWRHTSDTFFALWKKNTVDYYNSSLPFIWYDDIVRGYANSFLAKTFEVSISEIENVLKIKIGETPKEIKDLAKPEDLEFIMDSYTDVLKNLGLKEDFVSILPY